MFIVVKGVRGLDDIDVLAADVCSAVKRRGEQFDDEDRLTHWLTEDGVKFTPDSLSSALRQLERATLGVVGSGTRCRQQATVDQGR